MQTAYQDDENVKRFIQKYIAQAFVPLNLLDLHGRVSKQEKSFHIDNFI